MNIHNQAVNQGGTADCAYCFCIHSSLTENLFLSRAFLCVPSMVLILLVQVQSRVFTAKCSEPQVGISNGMDGGSGVAKFLSLRTET